MSNQIPERLINFRAYQDGIHLVGTGDVELPALEAMTDTIQGAGIAGELDSPTLGHYASMGLTVNWRTVSNEAIKLAAQKYHSLEFRGAQQNHDAATGQLVTQQLRVFVKAMPKNLSLGNLAAAAATDTSNEFEVSYIRVDINGAKKMELDKLNFICEVDGVDYLAPVRAALGMM